MQTKKIKIEAKDWPKKNPFNSFRKIRPIKEKRGINDELFMDYLEPKTSTPKKNKTPQKTSTTPFSKEQKDKIEKLKYSLDEGWITQEKYDELFQKLLIGE